MANSTPSTPKIIKPAVILCRIVVGLTFLFSGFVKGVDPIGVAIKFKEYFVALGIDILSPSSPLGVDFVSTFSISAAIGLSLFEFVLGAALLFGLYRKLAPTLAVLTMLFMTPLTLYLAIENPVHDCGCFGEALVLTNWETFYKNLVLMVATIFLLLYNHKAKDMFVKAIRWMPMLFSIFFILVISFLSYIYQPLLDFRPYKSGINIRETMAQEEVQPEYLFVYEKDGEQKEFTIENVPAGDASWVFVDRIERMPEGAEEKVELDFNVSDGDVDITNEILSDENYTFLLLVPSVEEYDNSWDDKIFNLYDYAFEHSYNFYALTPDAESLNNRLSEMGISFPCYTMDETVIETIARGNPAVAMLKDGILFWKIAPRELIDMSQYNVDIQSTPLSEVYEYNFLRRSIIILSIYILPLIFLYLCQEAVVLMIERIKLKRKKRIEDSNKIDYKPKKLETMRKNIVAGNWKMNKTLQEGVELAKQVEAALN